MQKGAKALLSAAQEFDLNATSCPRACSSFDS
jgi:hypothetical protein